MKNKWRNIKDTYFKELNQEKKGVPNKRKKYMYADALTFLQHCHKRKPRSVNRLGETSDKEEGEDFLEEMIELKSEVTEDHNQEDSYVPSGCSSAYTKRQTNQTYFQVHDSKPVESEDADKLFLLSILPDYKKLNEDDKIDFRILALQFFRDRKNKRVELNDQNANTST